MGSDFLYQNAEMYFINMDKIIKVVNANGTMKVRYSTPSEYVKAKMSEGVKYSVKTDDFFPYISSPTAVWTGFFTSRPGLKGYVRANSLLLQTARQVEVFTGGNGSSSARLWEAMALAQHHDGITGTELDWVAADYTMRIARGATEAVESLSAELSLLVANGTAPIIPFLTCTFLNISLCAVAESAPSHAYSVLLYNPQARPRVEVVLLPVYGESLQGVTVTDASGKEVASELVPTPLTSASKAGSATTAVAFQANVDGLGYHTYTVTPHTATIATSSSPSRTAPRKRHRSVDSEVTASDDSEETADPFIENEAVRLTFSATTGLLASWTDKVSGVVHAFSQQFLYYESSNHSSVGCSSSYNFEPQPGTSINLVTSDPPTLSVYKGALVQQVVQRWNSWLSQTVRLTQLPSTSSADAVTAMVEMEWVVGPVEFRDLKSKEVVTRYTTDVSSAGVSYTDSNGREFQRRQRDARPSWNYTVVAPVSGNYYPLSTATGLTDNSTGFYVLVDRAQGSASLQDGEVEVMVHRRLLYSCFGYNLNETGDGPGLILAGKHHLVLTTREEALRQTRLLQQRLYTPLRPLFAPSSAFLDHPTPSSDLIPAPAPTAQRALSLSFLATPLPLNVELMTLQVLHDGAVLLRLAHSFAVNESAQWSQPATVDLSTLFVQPINNVTAVTLTANDRRSSSAEVLSDTTVTIGPMQILSFLVHLHM